MRIHCNLDDNKTEITSKIYDHSSQLIKARVFTSFKLNLRVWVCVFAGS